MPYYKNNKLLFIHIPKTGGTVIESQLKAVDEQSLYSGNSNDVLEPPYNQISLQHQFYTTLYTFQHKLGINFDDISL